MDAFLEGVIANKSGLPPSFRLPPLLVLLCPLFKPDDVNFWLLTDDSVVVAGWLRSGKWLLLVVDDKEFAVLVADLKYHKFRIIAAENYCKNTLIDKLSPSKIWIQ